MNKQIVQVATMGVGALAIYLLVKKVFPTGNVINTGFENLYSKVTGSTQTPGADLYDATHSSNASSEQLVTLTDFFVKQGVTPETQQKALDLGWTQTDVNNASYAVTSQDQFDYGTQKMYELPPIF